MFSSDERIAFNRLYNKCTMEGFRIRNYDIIIISSSNIMLADLGSLGVTCSPGDPRFAGPSPTEVDGRF